LALVPPVFALADSATLIYSELLLTVDVNYQHLDETVVVLEDASGEHYLSATDLVRWRLKLPAPNLAIQYLDNSYYPLHALDGIAQRYDATALTLGIDVRADAFTQTVRSTVAVGIPPAQESGPGGFFNYSLFSADARAFQQRTGQFELGYFNRLGVATTTFIVNHLTEQPVATRLDSKWSRDFQQSMQTLSLGDGISTSGSWGRSVRFAGVQFGTNFATQPGFSTFKTQSIDGQALVPSTVDLFVNNALVSQQSVPPGPFHISNFPVVTGSGNVRVVVRDLFGREQVTTQPFYASQSLLRKGLSSYSYEVGSVRNNYGTQNDDYSGLIADVDIRRGLTDRLTAEVRAEVVSDQVTAGLGGEYLLQGIGTLSFHAAASQTGFLTLAGFDRQTQTWGIGIHTQKSSAGFVQIGIPNPSTADFYVSSANVSYAMGRWGSVGIAAVSQIQPNRPEAQLVSASYNVGVGRGANLNVSMLAELRGSKATQLMVMLTIPLDPMVQLSAIAQKLHTPDGYSNESSQVMVQSGLPVGTGYGYRLQTRSGGESEATLSHQNDVGTYSLSVEQESNSTTSTQLSMDGGIAFMGRSAFASRRIDQSFAVARLPDYPNVRVLADNQLAGHTNSKGNALIPRIRAYDVNVISVDQRDLPLDATIDSLSVVAVPFYRSGVDVLFPIRRSGSATLIIVLEDGKPIPVGASVTIEGQPDDTFVGTGGEVYLVDLGDKNVLHVQWRDGSCVLDVPYAQVDDPLPDLGRFVCKGVPR
jgi:outer membrane usher protein